MRQSGYKSDKNIMYFQPKLGRLGNMSLREKMGLIRQYWPKISLDLCNQINIFILSEERKKNNLISNSQPSHSRKEYDDFRS